jgi:CO/xanthine dehydrogenase Mo-binding subunit
MVLGGRLWHVIRKHRRLGRRMSILGTRVARTEDPRLLTAGGTYVDDLRLPEPAGAVRGTFVRSPVAHALITGIDVAAAAAAPGVVAVLTAADADDLPPGSSEPMTEPLLSSDRVRAVGGPVAIGVRHIEMPTTPERVWVAINEARAGQ